LRIEVTSIHLFLHDAEVMLILKQIDRPNDVRVMHLFHYKEFIFYQILNMVLLIVSPLYLLNGKGLLPGGL
jgi:hypothetical protein